VDHKLQQRVAALHALPVTLPAELVVGLTNAELDRLYVAELMGRLAYLHTLEKIVWRREPRVKGEA
jgi:hypothetical protein